MSAPNPAKPPSELVDYLFSRREAILNNLRTVCENDPTLSVVVTLTREEFNNLLGVVLDVLEQRLQGKPDGIDIATTANSHGLHRWQKAHGVTGLVRELTHLTQILLAETQLFHQLYPQVDLNLVLETNQQIVRLMHDTTNASAAKYDELQRLQAASRAADLENALNQMNELSRQRGEFLRRSSHDLRSGLGIAQSAAFLLNLESIDEAARSQYVDMLNRNLTNVQSLLKELMDLARLEAGQEPVQIEEFDAGALLNELVEGAQPLAKERGLILRADGSPSLPVKTDRMKVYRIVQNLLLNALTYTPSGMVSVSWSRENDFRWILSIQDSGPGLPNNLMSIFANQLRPTVEPTATMQPDQQQPVAVLPNDDHVIPPGPELAKTARSGQGEGVGLQIIKRLCELLEANLEIETRPGRGTLFRIRLLINHPNTA